jgi:phosphatidate phosphatase APP1
MRQSRAIEAASGKTFLTKHRRQRTRDDAALATPSVSTIVSLMRICAYRGYATRDRAFVVGRVLANTPPANPRDRDSGWRNLRDTYRRFATRELPGVPVTVSLGGREVTAKTDAEGYYDVELPHVLRNEQPWLSAEAHCVVRGQRLSAAHEILAPTPHAEFGIISDLDDTVIETNITSLWTAAKLTFMGNAKTRKPLEGVAALYASLQNGRAGRPVNPIFYVSTSPWNLYDLLCEFMQLNDIPRGPLFLRDWGRDSFRRTRTPGHRMKLDRTIKLLADFPELPFILVGDSGQHDAGVYAEAAALHAHRIKAIYIRDVEPTTATRRDDHVRQHIKTAAQHGVPMLLAPDSQAMAHHAAEIGLIPRREEAQVKTEIEKDQARPDPGMVAVKEALGIEATDAG